MKSIILSSAIALSLISGAAVAEVKINNSKQSVSVKNGGIVNTAAGQMTKAIQNVSSNKGKVTVKGTATQSTNLENGGIANTAAGMMSEAEQNVASNSGD